jgi:hypothetical protein
MTWALVVPIPLVRALLRCGVFFVKRPTALCLCVSCAAEALRTNSPPSLKMLDISSNPFGVTSGHLLAEAMMSNSTLVSLNLHNCGLGNESIPSVAAFISTNRTLKFLQCVCTVATVARVVR